MSTKHTSGPRKLTEPQKRLLGLACRENGVKRNAHAKRTIDALEKAGLVTANVQVQPDAVRGRHTLLYTVVATPSGRIVIGGANAYATSTVKKAVDATYDPEYLDDYGCLAGIASSTKEGISPAPKEGE